LIVQTLLERGAPLKISRRPHAAIETTEKNRRRCEERSDAAISMQVARMQTECPEQCQEIAAPFGFAMTLVLTMKL